MDLGADGHLPEPGVRDRDAAGAVVVAGQEERARRPTSCRSVVGRIRRIHRAGGSSSRSGTDRAGAPAPGDDGTVDRGQGDLRRLPDGSSLKRRTSRGQANGRGLGTRLMADRLLRGTRQRIYLAPTLEHEEAATARTSDGYPGPVGAAIRTMTSIRLPMYGMPRWSDAVHQPPTRRAHRPSATSLRRRGSRSSRTAAHASTPTLSRPISDSESRRRRTMHNSLCSWTFRREERRNRAPVRAAGDSRWCGTSAEANPSRPSSGNMRDQSTWVAKALGVTCARGRPARRTQADAATRSYAGTVISTDPPYYDNIGYSDLSDFFYVWLRRTLRTFILTCSRRCSCRRPRNWSRTRIGTTARRGASDSSRTASGDVFARARESARPRLSDHGLLRVQADRVGRGRRGVDWLGDAARGDDPSRLGDHVDLAPAQ